MISRWTALGAAALVAAVVISGCSSSGTTTPESSGQRTPGQSQPAGTSASNPTASGAPLKVGLICACTGVYGARIGAGKNTFDAWVKTVNSNGGIDGRRVDLIVKDDQTNPGTSVQAAKDLISQGVAAIIDNTVLDTAWAQTVAAAKVPVIGGAFTAVPFYTNPYFYPAGQTTDTVIDADIITAKTAGGTKLGQLYCAETPQCEEGATPRAATAKRLGLPVVYSAAVSATATSYTAQCVAAKQAGVDALFMGLGGAVFAKVAQDCSRQDYFPIYVQEGTGYSPFLASTPGLSDNLWVDMPILPIFSDDPLVQEMNEAVDKYVPGLRDQDEVWSQYAAQTWAGGKLLEQAVKSADVDPTATITAADIVRGLDSQKEQTLGGWSPPLTFEAGKPHSVDCWYTWHFEGGKPVAANDGKLTCSKGQPTS